MRSIVNIPPNGDNQAIYDILKRDLNLLSSGKFTPTLTNIANFDKIYGYYQNLGSICFIQIVLDSNAANGSIGSGTPNGQIKLPFLAKNDINYVQVNFNIVHFNGAAYSTLDRGIISPGSANLKPQALNTGLKTIYIDGYYWVN